MQISSAFGCLVSTVGIHSHVLSMNFACSPCLLPSSSFTISGKKKLKATATVQIWKIKTVPCIFTVVYVFNLNALVYFVTLPRHLTIPLTRFFQVNLKCQLTHTLPWEIIQIATVQLAKLLFCYVNLFLFCRSRWRCRRCRLSNLLLLSKNFAIMVTWRSHFSPLLSANFRIVIVHRSADKVFFCTRSLRKTCWFLDWVRLFSQRDLCLTNRFHSKICEW